MRQPVRFIQSIQVAHELGARIFVEMGPDAQLVACGQREYRDNAYWIASARRKQEASDVLNQAFSSFTRPASPYRGPIFWRAMGNVSPRHAIRLRPSVTGKNAPPPNEPADAVLAAGLAVANSAATALDLPVWKRLNSAPRDCTPSMSIGWFNAVRAMRLITAWTPSPLCAMDD
jgi:yersiniabactin nonribosomal peptide/polyketide synthase